MKPWSILAFLLLLLAPPSVQAQRTLELVTFDYPPYIIEENGQAKGPVVDAIREIFKRMHQGTTIRFYRSQRALLLMEMAKVDGMFTLKKTPERDQSMLFPGEALLEQEYVIFVPRDSKLNFDGNLASLQNITLGVAEKVSYGARFDTAVAQGAFPHLEVAYSFELNFKKLLAGRMDALISSRTMGTAMLRRLGGLEQCKVIGPPVEVVPSYFAFSRRLGNEELAKQFDTVVRAMKKDGSLKQLLELQ
ncbi:substrate-binding periplasmic protein [Uliginosibacterium gangwonense]|uniref:substrate-binding periplasmic protein n=1 Tax=Uliginosibacterium gangwonense TaxID=392736 RepID=UPI00036E127A|nr:transporter substrate-binding domain-containing protein [Uliginosibacterium gangwonense]